MSQRLMMIGERRGERLLWWIQSVLETARGPLRRSCAVLSGNGQQVLPNGREGSGADTRI
jgi:hypothetical protein